MNTAQAKAQRTAFRLVSILLSKKSNWGEMADAVGGLKTLDESFVAPFVASIVERGVQPSVDSGTRGHLVRAVECAPAEEAEWGLKKLKAAESVKQQKAEIQRSIKKLEVFLPSKTKPAYPDGPISSF